MRELHSEIEITASAERTWLILTDFASYLRWNPFIRRISGEPTTGEHLDVRLEPPNSRGMTFRPKVLRAEPNRELRWLGHLLVPGMFDGEHSFTIESIDENRVRFVQREAFKGLLVPLFARGLETNTRRGFEQMNRALKERAEAAPEQNQPPDVPPNRHHVGPQGARRCVCSLTCRVGGYSIKLVRTRAKVRRLAWKKPTTRSAWQRS